MKKINNRGFMTVEVLIVSTFIISVFVFLFVQFRSINQNYHVSFKYNTVNGLYAANNIRKYLNSINIDDMKEEIDDSFYVDITECPIQYITRLTYCETLFEKLDVDTVYITNQDLTDLKSSLRNSLKYVFKEDMKDFINYIKYDSQKIGYRIIVKFNDETFASIKL